MANTKITKRKETTGIFTRRFNCKKCPKTFCSISTLRRHHKELHEPAATMFECKHCDATFTRKSNAITHLKSKHPDKAKEDYNSFIQNPREMAKAVKNGDPLKPSRKNGTGKTPIFRIKAGKSPHEYKKTINKYIGTGLIPFRFRHFYSKKHSKIHNKRLRLCHGPYSKDHIDLTTSSSDDTICLDELPEELWDRHVFVHSIYNIFS
ncbi:KRAB [Mytilus edulis]|uniref:KRAB n=1 Tax=Mytilus edulis TaxID=6550 RepID=A0A8S3SBA9_MYTED|nr:KRAB [Mytilus edulis]